MRAYALTRQWAQWNGRPDPDLYVDQLLKEVVLAKSKKQYSPRLVQAQALLTELSNRQQSLVEVAVPHLRSYLPRDTPIKGQILLAVFIPTYAFSWGDGSIVIDLAADFWKGNPDKVFNLVIHELYHNGYGAHQKGVSANEARSPQALIDHVLWQTQNEGLATYVAYRAKPVELTMRDYQLLDNPSEVRARFKLLQQLLADLATAVEEGLPKVREEIQSIGDSQRAFHVVGAYMARRIEEQKGRDALVQTIDAGPRAFFAAYAATSAPPGLRLVISTL